MIGTRKRNHGGTPGRRHDDRGQGIRRDELVVRDVRNEDGHGVLTRGQAVDRRVTDDELPGDERESRRD